MTSLSSGVLKEIVACSDPEALPERPVLQVLGVKKMVTAGQERYRLVLSDGDQYYTSAMLATQLNSEVKDQDDEGVCKYCILRLDRYTCNVIQQTRKIIILLEITLLESCSNGKIGDPIQLSDQIVNQPETGQANRENIAQRPQPQTKTDQGQKPQSSFYASKPSGGNTGGDLVPKSPSGKSVFPISSLTPYQNRWTVCVRVTNRGAIRTWSNTRGEGKLFSVDLLDESGEIRATGFNDAVDKYYEMMEPGKIFYITKATLKTANKQYSNMKNDYEMSFNNDTLIEPCTEDKDLPQIQYNFVSIKDLESVNKDTLVDLLGVVKSCGEITQITTKANNKQVSKRDLVLMDRSGVTVNATLWGDEAEKFSQHSSSSSAVVVAVKGAKVSDFGGRSLSVLNSSVFNVNPDIPECHTLRGWYDEAGKDVSVKSISGQAGSGGGGGPYKILGQIKEERLGENEKPDYFNVRATAVFYKKENCMYMACPSEECNKKVIEENGNYRCEKCDQTFPNFKWRLILNLNVADFSGNQWLTAFQESAEAILGTTAAELGRLREQDEATFERIFTEATFKNFVFKVRAKMETYQDETRLKCSAVTASPVDFKSESRRLYGEIQALEAM